MTGRRLRTPDWGQDHLSLDAIVAYVDDELAVGAHHRADTHLACCLDCRAEVVAQRQARAALRTAGGPALPSSLLHTLRAIPVEAELPPPPPGLGITADGQFVLLRDFAQPDFAQPDFAQPDFPQPDFPQPDGPRSDGPRVEPRRLSRRARFGAVSGLAIGALAVGALATTATPATPHGRGVLSGAVLSGSARAGALSDAAVVLTSDPASPDSSPGYGPDTATPDPSATDGAGVLDPQVRQRLDRAPVAFYRSP
jgi:anti-sigma factor RsiW